MKFCSLVNFKVRRNRILRGDRIRDTEVS